MKKWLLCLSISVFTLTMAGCSAENSVILKKTDIISHLVDQKKWKQATSKVNDLKDAYQDQKLKLQFLGDEQEYESISREMNKLIPALEEKDVLEVKKGLATINGYVESIYMDN
ncbi:DUF4363 family protein [Tuberibacillus sp. Marseille-P3662]|uniref:DUF4363 family protein n=1 Tax=Tuberibacillus sp. Marseille-P3662 TaxID=1965358 RepID=UPI001594114F|nr:DUF4363 family protein [Tuberibacillus sp. Marseille-P3662]